MLHNDDFDESMKDKILAELVAKMEDVIAGSLKDRSGLAVEVQAPDKEHLQEGLEKAKDVVSKGPESLSPAEEDKSDEERLMELMEDEESEKDKR